MYVQLASVWRPAKRIRLPQARDPVRQIGPDRLEAHAPAHRREDRARRFGQAAVEDDDVAVEPGMVGPEGIEHDDGARHVRIRHGGGEAHVSGVRQGVHQVGATRSPEIELEGCQGLFTMSSTPGRRHPRPARARRPPT